MKLAIFDLDNTLFCEHDYLINVLKLFLKSEKKEDLLQKKKITLQFNRNRINILKDLLNSVDLYTVENHNKIFKIYRKGYFELNLRKDIKKNFNYLKIKGFKIAVLTNGIVDVQKNKVKLLKLKPLVDKIFYARKKGLAFEKPCEIAFKRVLEHFNTKPSCTIMIGDNFQNDYYGARKVGIKSILLRNSGLNLVANSARNVSNAIKIISKRRLK